MATIRDIGFKVLSHNDIQTFDNRKEALTDINSVLFKHAFYVATPKMINRVKNMLLPLKEKYKNSPIEKKLNEYLNLSPNTTGWQDAAIQDMRKRNGKYLEALRTKTLSYQRMIEMVENNKVVWNTGYNELPDSTSKRAFIRMQKELIERINSYWELG